MGDLHTTLTMKFLYRSPNQAEVVLGFRFIPTSVGAHYFSGDKPMLVMAHWSGTYTHVGGDADVIRRHQVLGDTEGVSTTKNITVARRYARGRPLGYRYVARIPIEWLKQHKIHMKDSALCGLAAPKPEDEEVILVSENLEPFPSTLVDKIWRINETGELEEGDVQSFQCR